MATIKFLPSNIEMEAAANSKILAAAIRGKVDIRYGCAAGRCGTCGVKIKLHEQSQVTPIGADEKQLLERMDLSTDGEIRLACRARILAGSVEVDLDFQDQYSPDQGNEYE